MTRFVDSGKGKAILALVGAAFALSACTKNKEDEKAQVMHTSLRDDVKTFDPANAYDSVSLEVLPNFMESLYGYDYVSEQFKIVPRLAADMPTYSKDRLTVTIRIKPGIRYSDDACFKATQGKGRELVAQDFILGFKRLADPGVQSQGTWIFDGRLVGFTEFAKKLKDAPKDQLRKALYETEFEGAKALDDHTLQLKLTKPYPQLMYMLAMTFTAPVAKEALEAYGDERGQINANPIGTGAFKLDHWSHGHEVVMVRNANYRADLVPPGAGPDAGKPMPLLDKVTFPIVKEEQPKWLQLQKGEIDLGTIPKDSFNQAMSGPGLVADELKKKGIQLDVVKGSVFYWIEFNVKDKVLSNKLVRQAISSSIDREKWIEIFTNGRGHKQTTVAPPGLVDRVEDAKLKYDLDLARAKELLKKAGFPGGKGLPVITFDLRGADSVNRQLGEFIGQQLEQIGVKINVVLNTFPAYLEKSNRGQLQMSYGGWQLDYPDVENAYQLLYGPNASPGPNSSMYDNPKYDKLYQQMSTMEPGLARAKIVRQMDEIIQEDAPWAFGFYRDEYTLYYGWLLNYRGNAFLKDSYKFYRIDKEMKRQFLAGAKN